MDVLDLSLALAVVVLAGLGLWLFFEGRMPGNDSPEAGFGQRVTLVGLLAAAEVADSL